MEEIKKKIFTKREYLNKPVKCLETGIIYDDIKEAASVIYGMEFREFNTMGKLITKGSRIKGNHYIFI